MTTSPACPLLIIAGTRPERFKLLPLMAAPGLAATWLWTGQQPLPAGCSGEPPWRSLGTPPHPLHRRPMQTWLEARLDQQLRLLRPGAVLVQGDTASALAGARAAHALRIPLVHLEAGLRSGCLRSPFPEEAYRRHISRLACWHLAPSRRAVAALREEGIAAERIIEVGSTAVDGVRSWQGRPAPPRHDLLVDVHRRENFGRPRRRLAAALCQLADQGWRIGLLRQPNPRWDRFWQDLLPARPGIDLLAPLDRHQWFAAACAARAVLSDSGGAAEELPYLGVPLLIYRRRIERVEPLVSGHALQLDPDDPRPLAVRIGAALQARSWPCAWPLHADSPYGDGRAGQRVAAALGRILAATAPPEYTIERSTECLSTAQLLPT